MTYKPRPEAKALLDAAIAHINGLAYQATARYIYYRMLEIPELGIKKSTKSYKRFLALTSKARKSWYDGWDPQSMADSSRVSFSAPNGFDSVSAWIDGMEHSAPVLDRMEGQHTIVEVWFEAAAMVDQFRHVLRGYSITMHPFKGDASIPFKYSIAEGLSQYARKYPDKHIVVLYFGDYDPKGLEIPENAKRDIERWTDAEFEFIRVGINEDQIDELELPADIERPNCYQWEGVPDAHARRLILDAVNDHWDIEAERRVRAKEDRAGDMWAEKSAVLLQEIKDELEDSEE